MTPRNSHSLDDVFRDSVVDGHLGEYIYAQPVKYLPSNKIIMVQECYWTLNVYLDCCHVRMFIASALLAACTVFYIPRINVMELVRCKVLRWGANSEQDLPLRLISVHST